MTRQEKLAQLERDLGVRGRRRRRPRPRTGCGGRRRRDRRDHAPRRVDEPPAARGGRAANAIQRYLVEETRLGSRRSSTRSASTACSPGGALLPAVDRRGRHVRSGRCRRRRRDDPPADARHRGAPCPGARPRHRPRPALGPRSRRPTARTRTSRRELGLAYIRGPPGSRSRERRARHRQAHGRPRAGRGRAATRRPPTSARASCATSSCSPFEAAVRAGRLGEHHARVLRRRRRAVPCLARAARRRSCASEWGFDGIVASDYIGIEMLATAASADRGPGDGSRAGDERRGRPGAAARGRLRRAARGGAGRRPDRRGAARSCRRADPPDEVPARALRAARTSTRRPSARGPRWKPRKTRAGLAARAAIDRPARERGRAADRARRRIAWR